MDAPGTDPVLRDIFQVVREFQSFRLALRGGAVPANEPALLVAEEAEKALLRMGSVLRAAVAVEGHKVRLLEARVSTLDERLTKAEARLKRGGE
jgi:hypothetical protein